MTGLVSTICWTPHAKRFRLGAAGPGDDLRHDRILLPAPIKEIEIIGEAASRISPEGRSGAPGIPWEKVTAMRNRLIHGYFDWNVEVIWSTLTSNLPDLVRELEYALSDRT